MYSFHGAKPPALHLINFLLFIWLKLLLPFLSFFLSGNAAVWGRARLPGAFSQSSFKRGLKLSRFVRLGFCHRVGTRRSKERIGSRNEFLLDQKVEWNGTNQWEKSRGDAVGGGSSPLGDHLQRLCSACRRLRTEPPLPPWFGFGVDRCPEVAFHIWRPSCVKPEIKILMRSANLEKQLRHKHRGRLYLEMRRVRLAELLTHNPHSWLPPCFPYSASYLTQPCTCLPDRPGFSFFFFSLQ